MNLAVHIVMYAYYALAALSIRVPWKQWVTRLQILQFVVDLLVCGFAWYSAGVARNLSHTSLPYYGDCAGTHSSALAGVAVLSSYLVLFIRFYFFVYRADKKIRTE
jgi:hypothetical protein